MSPEHDTSGRAADTSGRAADTRYIQSLVWQYNQARVVPVARLAAVKSAGGSWQWVLYRFCVFLV